MVIPKGVPALKLYQNGRQAHSIFLTFGVCKIVHGFVVLGNHGQHQKSLQACLAGATTIAQDHGVQGCNVER